MENNKYTTAEEIMSMVNATHKNKVTNITDFINWCAECEVNVLKEYHYRIKYTDIQLEVVDGKIKMPCNVYRILKLKDATGDSYKLIHNYTENGAYIFVKDDVGVKGDDNKLYLWLTYEGLPMDANNGMPLILKGHELACKAYCVKEMYYEDYINTTIDENRWRSIKEELDTAIANSSTGIRYVSHSDKERYFRILYNMVQDTRYYRGV